MENVKNFKKLLRYLPPDICEIILEYTRVLFLDIIESPPNNLLNGCSVTFVYYGTIEIERHINSYYYPIFIDFYENFQKTLCHINVMQICHLHNVFTISYNNMIYEDNEHIRFDDTNDNICCFSINEILENHEFDDVKNAFDNLYKIIKNIKQP